MNWEDECYLLSKRKFRENANIINVFSLTKGKVVGIVYGGNSRKIRNYLQISNNFKIPVFVYQVSGEYSLLKNGVKNKSINEDAILESLMAFKRAGASAIITYFALDIAKKLNKN